MTTKLTLTVEDAVVKKAKIYSKQTGRSLSKLIQTYLETIIEDYRNNEDISSRLKKIAGSVNLPPDFDEKKELENYFNNKHL